VASIEPADVASLVAQLIAEGLARESIRKTRATLAMVLDFAAVQPNPARDKGVKLPREDRAEIQPPTAAHVLAVLPSLPTRYRLPVLVLDATGMRVGELEGLAWGDVDEHEGRWRVSAANAKTGKARWITPPDVLFDAVAALCPRDDRTATRRVLEGVTADRLRTALTRACTAVGVPAFSPHDLRHPRATLWHLGGTPAATASAWLGHSAQEHCGRTRTPCSIGRSSTTRPRSRDLRRRGPTQEPRDDARGPDDARESKTQNVRLDAGSADVAAGRRHRHVFAVLDGRLVHPGGPDRLHTEILMARAVPTPCPLRRQKPPISRDVRIPYGPF
jgi:site-specific recombinase XerD